jgi:hypothetical protein
MRLLVVLFLLTFIGCESKLPRISTDQIESIEVQIYKNSELFGIKEDFKVMIPQSDWESILDFIIPNQYADSSPSGVQVGTIMIKYRDGKIVPISVYWAGKNPCMVTLDDNHFYYAKNNPGAPDGAVGLMRKVISIREVVSKENERREKGIQ